VVNLAFGCLPNNVCPFVNTGVITGDELFQLSKACNGIGHLPIIKDMNKATVGDLRISAQLELQLTAQETANCTKKELIERIVAQRIDQQTYVGISHVFRVLVDHAHPFTIVVSERVGQSAKAFVRLRFSVSKHGIIFTGGQNPVAHLEF
jgi:hypothetical protein